MASDGADGSGNEVKGAVVVFPCGNFGGAGGLTREIQSEFGLGQELVPKKVGEGFGADGKDA